MRASRRCSRASACSRNRSTKRTSRRIVAKWTGIPVTKMLESEVQKLVRMEELLAQTRRRPGEAL